MSNLPLIRKDSFLLNVQKNEEAYLRYVIRRSKQTIEKLDPKELELEGADVVKRAGRTLERYYIVPVHRISARLKRDYKGYISRSFIDRYSEVRWKKKEASW